ncbi:MAG TPA: hypothetical protein VFX96_12260 [Pyrinomonadaceae bacterium]|nr:hypothetical protein [Pyrinomonadaceae bacterium]
MYKSLARLLTACALAALVLFASSAPARAQAGEKRRDGPIPGPIIKLPPGQYDVTPAPAADADEQQQKRTTRALASQRWEYCTIYQVNYQKRDYSSNWTGVAFIRYYRGGGEQVEGGNEDEALANAMTKLGEEGWELVAIRESIGLSEGTGTATHSYFFKRPL